MRRIVVPKYSKTSNSGVPPLSPMEVDGQTPGRPFSSVRANCQEPMDIGSTSKKIRTPSQGSAAKPRSSPRLSEAKQVHLISSKTRSQLSANPNHNWSQLFKEAPPKRKRGDQNDVPRYQSTFVSFSPYSAAAQNFFKTV